MEKKTLSERFWSKVNNERGYNTINQLAYNPDRLLFKHKKRWIDIDSDGNVYHNEGDTE